MEDIVIFIEEGQRFIKCLMFRELDVANTKFSIVNQYRYDYGGRARFSLH